MANTAFLNYFKGLIDTLEAWFIHNVTMQEHILPISLESDDFDKELSAAPRGMLRESVENYKRKKLNFDKQHKKVEPEEDFEKETSIFHHLMHLIYLFL